MDTPTKRDGFPLPSSLKVLPGTEAAQAAYARAAQIQPLIRRAATKSPPDFRVLALYAPFAGNTPADYLFNDATYAIDTLALLDGGDPDIAALDGVQLVVNLISDLTYMWVDPRIDFETREV